MLYRDICRILSFYFFGLFALLLIPFAIALSSEWIFHSPHPRPSAMAFFWTALITCCLAFILRKVGKKASRHLYRKEALFLVLTIYFLTSAIGALPFLFSKTLSNPLDALFEATSGLTTTGATLLEAKKYNPITLAEVPIKKKLTTGLETTYTYYGTVTPFGNLQGIEALGPALLFWRSFMQWLGGGGIILLFVAILPALGVGGKIFYQTEITGPTKKFLTPKLKQTALLLWKVYLGLTILEILLLKIVHPQLPLFDACIIALSTLSTGGFTPRNGSIGAYHNAPMEWVILVFMVLGSISFPLYVFLLNKKYKRLKDAELKGFLIIVACTCLFAAGQLLLRKPPEHFLTTLRHAAFQVISAQTSTGFVVANYDVWPFSIQTLMLILMFVGGMAGSTAGGIKIIRYQIGTKTLWNKIETTFRPNVIRECHIGTRLISTQTATTVLCYFLIAGALTILGTFLLVWDNIDPETSLTTIACMLNNVGFAFRVAGPEGSFAFLSNFSKSISILWMIAGRLEFFALLIFLVPSYWKKA